MAVKQGGIVDCPIKCEISANKNTVCYICSVLYTFEVIKLVLVSDMPRKYYHSVECLKVEAVAQAWVTMAHLQRRIDLYLYLYSFVQP